MSNENISIEQMKALREKASAAYYKGETLEMTDEEFDVLTAKLSEAGVEEEVGHGYVPEDPASTIKHQYPLLSLAKVRTMDEIERWASKFPLFPNYVIQPKYDGLALDITFSEDGELISAATRGDGKVGENVTHTVKAMMASGRMPDKINSDGFTGNTHVLGEIYMTYEDLIRLNEAQDDREYSNPRNAAAGLLRRKSVDLSRFLSFVAYDSNHYTEDEVDFLEGNGFVTPKDHFYKVAKSLNEVKEAITFLGNEKKDSFNDFLAKHLASTATVIIKYNSKETEVEPLDFFTPVKPSTVEKFNFDIDGVVIKLRGSRAQREEIGNSTSAPRWAVAFKYANVYSQTRIRKVEWNPTRTGRLVPVAIFDEVVLAGNAKTTRATLHNYAQFKLHDLHEGDLINITRSNEVIPYVVGKAQPSVEGAVAFTAPTFYPSEEFPVTLNATGLDLLLHPEAPANPVASIEYSLKALDVKGVGESLIRELYDAALISDFLDILNITAADIVTLRGITLKPGETSKSAENAIAAIQTAFDRPLWRWIAAMGMRLIASNKSPILEARYSTLDELAKATASELNALEGFGGEKSASVLNASARIQEWADRLRDEHNFVPAPEAKAEIVESKGAVDYNGKKVVVTGTFPTMKRGDVEAWVKARGGKISGSVSSSTDILIAGEKAGTKLAKAESLGTVQIISAEDFEKDA